jgi:hypothetical protein
MFKLLRRLVSFVFVLGLIFVILIVRVDLVIATLLAVPPTSIGLAVICKSTSGWAGGLIARLLLSS